MAVQQASHDGLITSLNENDVLLGRGLGPSNFVGNRRFRTVAEKRKAEYNALVSYNDKAGIAKEVYLTIRLKGGRFLKLARSCTRYPPRSVVETGVWQEADEKTALEKCKQLLREKPVQSKKARKKQHNKKKQVSFGDPTKQTRTPVSPSPEGSIKGRPPVPASYVPFASTLGNGIPLSSPHIHDPMIPATTISQGVWPTVSDSSNLLPPRFVRPIISKDESGVLRQLLWNHQQPYQQPQVPFGLKSYNGMMPPLLARRSRLDGGYQGQRQQRWEKQRDDTMVMLLAQYGAAEATNFCQKVPPQAPNKHPLTGGTIHSIPSSEADDKREAAIALFAMPRNTRPPTL